MEEAWFEIINDKAVTVTLDLFSMGIVLFKEELSKEDFMLRL
jgi:hypothetical protein